jgi:diguanylate cyclase (GGDEF)-like protein/PAS domain S-box-containing protein
MPLTGLKARSRNRPLRVLFRTILALLVSIYGMALFYFWHVNLAQIESSLHHLNSILCQGVRTTLKGHELILRGLGEELLQLGALQQPEVGRGLIERMGLIDPGMAGFGLARTDGQLLLVSGIPPGKPLPNLALRAESRDSFREVLGARHLKTGRPYFFHSLGQWVVPIRTTLFDPAGTPQAVMAAGYHIKNASTAWVNTELPRHIQIILTRDDGYSIFAQPVLKDAHTNPADPLFSRRLPQPTLDTLASLDRQRAFLPIVTSRGQELHQYLAYNYIAEYGLHAAVLIGRSAVIREWLNRILFPSVFFLVFLLGGAWAYHRAMQRQMAADREINQLSAWQQAVLNGAAYSIISTDVDGNIVSFNHAAEKLLGYQAAEVVGKQTPVLFHDRVEMASRAKLLSRGLGHTVEPGLEVFSARALRGEIDEAEWTYVRKDGSRIPVYLSITPLYGEEMTLMGLLGIAVDLTEKKAIQLHLRESNQRYRTLFEAAGDAILLMQDGRFLDCNPATLSLFGCRREDIIGSNPEQFSPECQPDGQRSADQAQARIHAAQEGRPQFFEWRHQRLDGTPFDAEVGLNAMQIGTETSLLAVVRDITERKRFTEEIAFQTRHDSLTGLPNRTALHEAFDAFVKASTEAHRHVHLLLLDLDRFKEINDTLGHHFGDEVLCTLGKRMEVVFTENRSRVFRLGGDEFAVLHGAEQLSETASAQGQTYVEALREPCTINGVQLSVGASVGVACYPQHGRDSHELLRAADVAMYRAKRLSLGVMVYDRQFDSYSTERLSLANELAQAVRQRQLLLHYQPKIDIASGQVVGFEALVRWRHPTRGLLFPDSFIDLVEMSELIHSFTQEVIAIAVQDKQYLCTLGYGQSVAVNLSARNLFNRSCLDSLLQALKNHGLSCTEIELELTESAVMDDPGHAIELLERFQAAGVRIAIDDFGTGYSSLAYLRRLPVFALKIDRGFVMQMVKNSQDRAIVKSTIALAHSIDLKVVAEGVEDEATLAMLRRMGCDFAQGYHISRPLPLKELIVWLAARPPPESQTADQ